jgi:hypothetical protein
MKAKRESIQNPADTDFRRIPLESLNFHNFQTKEIRRADKMLYAGLSARWMSRIPSLNPADQLSSAEFIRRLIKT